MGERLGPQIKQEGVEPILSVEVGQVFRPFVGLKLEKDLNGIVREKIDIPFQFKFKGIDGELDVNADYYDSPVVPETPFGEVKKIFVFDGRKKNVVAIPLTMAMSFSIRKVEDYDTLQRHMLKFELGKKTRFLLFGFSRYNLAREHIGEKIAKEGYDRVTFSEWSRSGNTRDISDIWFPFDRVKLSRIKAQIVERTA